MLFEDREFESTDAAFVLELIVLLAISGVLIGEGVKMRKTDIAKEELNKILASDMNYNSVNVKYFDWYTNNDSEYLFKFTGSAVNSYDEEIDFFACSYEVSEKQYYEMVSYIKDLKVKDVEELDSLGLVKKLTEIVKGAFDI